MGLTIGVDIGGTKIAAGVVDEDGNILSTYKVPTPGTPDAIVDAIASAVDGARAGHEIVGVGIGAAGYVNRQRSTVYFAPNIDWRQEPLKEKVEQRVGLPVVVENDANAAAWGEYRFGAGKGHRERHLHHARHGPGRRHHHRQQAAPRPLRRGRRVRPHPDGAGRPAVRLRQPGLLGAVRLRPRPGPLRQAARQRHPRERRDPARARRRHPRGHRGQAHLDGRPPGRPGGGRLLPRTGPLGGCRASPTWPRSSTRPRSSSAAGSPTRASWCSTRSASPTSAGWSAGTGVRSPTSSRPNSATRPAW